MKFQEVKEQYKGPVVFAAGCAATHLAVSVANTLSFNSKTHQ